MPVARFSLIMDVPVGRGEGGRLKNKEFVSFKTFNLLHGHKLHYSGCIVYNTFLPITKEALNCAEIKVVLC